MNAFDELVSRYPALKDCAIDAKAAAERIVRCYREGGKLLLCGNGGSCADCEHIAGELMKGFLLRRPLGESFAGKLRAFGEDGAYLTARLQGGLPAVALNACAISSAAINDLGGDMGFAQQVAGLGRAGDVIVGISTSGNARNVRLALVTARAMGMTAVGLTGADGGKMADACDILVRVPETETFKVQELHLPVYHAVCAHVEASIFGENA